MEPAAPSPPSEPQFSPAEVRRLYWLKDHGFLRAIWTNFHKLDEEVWRHNHPSPVRLAQLQAMGAASILSLRGLNGDISKMEAATCARLGLPFEAVSLRALALPDQAQLLKLFDDLRTMPKPLVIHCKSGSDRTGLASVIYLHAFKGVPLPEARKQLGLRFIHNPWGKARIVNRLLDAYATTHDATGIGMEDWVRTQYDPATLS
ncbi:tyrosine-protein phosphatase [Gymnodinialimonas hymeniacidonis]|uniref:tyrosine-protein phosphatase n=1 Tax=Gymnodinialimonas hymeniacidonis TaxID=3126508 RepID=UPI0034C69E41